MEKKITHCIVLSSLEDLEEEIENHKNDKLENVEYDVDVECQMNQEFLDKLSDSSIGENMMNLDCRPEYNSVVPCVDISEVNFPKLKRMSFIHQGVKAIHFTQENTPSLKSVTIEQPSHDAEYFLLDLPELDCINLQFIMIRDPSGFGKSLSSCPKLERVQFYKVWGLGVPKSKTHKLVLPNCTDLDFYRSDDLNHLRIWAPKLRIVNLQACYSMEEVNILDRRPNGYSGPAYKFSGKLGKYKVNCLNTQRPSGNLVSHERCKLIFPESNEIEDHMDVDPFEWFNIKMNNIDEDNEH